MISTFAFRIGSQLFSVRPQDLLVISLAHTSKCSS